MLYTIKCEQLYLHCDNISGVFHYALNTLFNCLQSQQQLVLLTCSTEFSVHVKRIGKNIFALPYFAISNRTDYATVPSAAYKVDQNKSLQSDS